MSDYITGHIRTYVPMAVAWVLLQLGNWGWDVTDADVAAASTAVLALIFVLYYGLVRALAERWPWVGSLLGVNKAPTYDA